MEIMIVEDHPLVSEGLQKLLKEKELASSVPAVKSGEECLRALELYQPDILLLDINLPDISGLELCSIISKRWPGIRIIALSSYNTRTVISRMLENGARAYLVKDADGEEICHAIRQVAAGQLYYNEQIRALLEGKGQDSSALLTNREKQVLKLIADGFTNNEIADKIFVSPLTVDSHRKNLLLKLGARNTAALVKIALMAGLLEDE